jgi:hypothetical protein
MRYVEFCNLSQIANDASVLMPKAHSRFRNSKICALQIEPGMGKRRIA